VPVCAEATATILDNGSITARVSHPELRAPRSRVPEEQEAVTAIYDAWPSPDAQNREAAQFTCAAWPSLLERNSVHRVCLLTSPCGW
jgi:hypothetical protein